jgi:hypothetical protein
MSGRSCALTFDDLDTGDGDKPQVAATCRPLLELSEAGDPFGREFLDESFVTRHVRTPDRDDPASLGLVSSFEPSKYPPGALKPVSCRLIAIVKVRRQLRALTLELAIRFLASLRFELL